MQWGSPSLLHALWLLLPAMLLLLWSARRRARAAARLAETAAWVRLAPAYRPQRARWRTVLWLAALAFALAALARPQWGFTLKEHHAEGIDLLVLLDTSRSMLAQDVKPNRIQQAKWGITELVRKLQGDRVGLMPFAGSAYLYCPLTSDYGAFTFTLDDVHVGLVPRGGTAIGQALAEARKALADQAKGDRAILLITDGEDLEGDPLAEIPALKEAEIRVYAVGIGTPEGEVIRIETRDGRSDFLKNSAGEVVKSRLQESALARIAVETGGMYVRAQPGDFGLDRIYEQGLSKLLRAQHETRMLKIYEDRFQWFLLPAFGLLFVEALLAVNADRARSAKEDQP